MKIKHWPPATSLCTAAPLHLGPGPTLQPQACHSPCLLSKPLSEFTPLFSGSLTPPHPASRAHQLYLVRDLRTKRDPGACEREARHVTTVGGGGKPRIPPPLSPLLSNSPRPRQETRRPDFPRFLQDTEAAGKGGASIKDRDYQPPAPLLSESEALR